uniref:Uncharacterized protein n=1 Tax=Arundo donax TaxID=35708 RepID=A0A0A9H501_ARUDO
MAWGGLAWQKVSVARDCGGWARRAAAGELGEWLQ